MKEIKITEENVEVLINRYKWSCSRCGKLPEIGEVWVRTRSRIYCPRCAEIVYMDLPDVSDKELEEFEVSFMPLEVMAVWRGRRKK